MNLNVYHNHKYRSLLILVIAVLWLPTSWSQEYSQRERLTKIYKMQITPAQAGLVFVATENLRLGDAQADKGGDTMLAVVRYSDAVELDINGEPEPRAQVPFEVVAFNDDYNRPVVSGGDRWASSLRFNADGRSTYEVIVMPYSNRSIGTTELVINCSSCGFANGRYRNRVPVGGAVHRYVEGNVFDISSWFVWGRADIEMYVFKVFIDARGQRIYRSGNVSPDEYNVDYRGTGIYNNDKSDSGTVPKIHTGDFAIESAPYQFVLVGNRYPVTRDTSSATLTVSEGERQSGYFQPAFLRDLCIAPASENDIPETIEGTHCFERDFLGELTGHVIAEAYPYDVAQPFWSDGATKERYFSLHPQYSFEINSNGLWKFPKRAVMIKNFRDDHGQIFETRFVAKTESENRLVYSYRWIWQNGVAQTYRVDTKTNEPSITLRLDNKNVVWSYPTTSECHQCHDDFSSEDEDFYLGLKTRQLNIERYYPYHQRTGNQIFTLESLGLITGAGVAKAKTEIPLVPRANTFHGEKLVGSNEQARAWLDSNCGYCHRDGKLFWDAQYDNSLADSDICLFIQAGNPNDSRFMDVTAANPIPTMPKLAITQQDDVGRNTLHRWISGMSGCGPQYVELVNQYDFRCLSAGSTMKTTSCVGQDLTQRLRIRDDGDGGFSIMTNATDCIVPQNAENSTAVKVDTCGTATWKRRWLPGGDYQIIAAENTAVCLKREYNDIVLENCSTKSPMRWLDFSRN